MRIASDTKRASRAWVGQIGRNLFQSSFLRGHLPAQKAIRTFSERKAHGVLSRNFPSGGRINSFAMVKLAAIASISTF